MTTRTTRSSKRNSTKISTPPFPSNVNVESATGMSARTVAKLGHENDEPPAKRHNFKGMHIRKIGDKFLPIMLLAERAVKNQRTPNLRREYYARHIYRDRKYDCWVSARDIFFLDAEIMAKVNMPIPFDIEKSVINEKMEIKLCEEAAPGCISQSQMDSLNEFLKKRDDWEKYFGKSTQCSFSDEVTRIRRVDEIIVGEDTIRIPYYSPFAESLQKDTLFMCENCFNFEGNAAYAKIHAEKFCQKRNKSGGYEIGKSLYEDAVSGIGVYEVEPEREERFCQNLCLLAKCYIEMKGDCYDPHAYNFYVLFLLGNNNKEGGAMTTTTRRPHPQRGAQQGRPVGFFSKEKKQSRVYNVGCLFVLPQFQGRGYGRFLVDFSYWLSRGERQRAGPEPPLSHQGRKTYFAHWEWEICKRLKNKDTTIEALSEKTSICKSAILAALERMNFLKYVSGDKVCLKGSVIDRKMMELKAPRIAIRAKNFKKTFAASKRTFSSESGSSFYDFQDSDSENTDATICDAKMEGNFA